MKIFKFLILGFIISLLFPPYFFAPLGFVVFPYICIFIENNKFNLKKIDLFKYSFSFSFAFLLSFLFWIQNPFYVFDETKNIFFLSLLLIILLAFIFSLTFTLIVKYNNFIPTLFLVPLLFVIYEFIVSIIFSGFPWLTFSLILSNLDLFSYIVRNFGTLISSFITIQLFCIPFIFLTKKTNKIKNIYYSTFIILPLLIVIFINNISIDNSKDLSKKINLEIFQLNQNIIKYIQDPEIRLKEIIGHIIKSKAELLIFGENNYPYIISKQDLTFIQSFLKENQKLIIGGTRLERDNYYNTLVHINNDNILYFDKKILVPFGEYLPLREFLFFLEPISGQYDFSIGFKNRLIKIDDKISYIPVICYEILFYWKLINKLNYDSDFIINITNDIWFGNIIGPYQHFYLTKLRAAEFNKPIIRVSNNGISGVISENGIVLTKTELNKAQVIKYSIQFKKNTNFYKMHFYLNLYFFFICFLLIFINVKIKNEIS